MFYCIGVFRWLESSELNELKVADLKHELEESDEETSGIKAASLKSTNDSWWNYRKEIRENVQSI